MVGSTNLVTRFSEEMIKKAGVFARAATWVFESRNPGAKSSDARKKAARSKKMGKGLRGVLSLGAGRRHGGKRDLAGSAGRPKAWFMDSVMNQFRANDIKVMFNLDIQVVIAEGQADNYIIKHSRVLRLQEPNRSIHVLSVDYDLLCLSTGVDTLIDIARHKHCTKDRLLAVLGVGASTLSNAYAMSGCDDVSISRRLRRFAGTPKPLQGTISRECWAFLLLESWRLILKGS